mgnify:FL=1
MEQPKKRTSMSVMEMGKLLGLGKTESYYLVRKNYFKVITVGTTMRVMIPSFEKWYANQSFYKKVDGPEPGSQLKQASMNAEELGALLGITESSAYDLIAKGHFEKVDVLGKMRISNESFWKWYSTQSIYRTVEDQAKDSEKMESTLRMPEIARMLGIHRNQVYDIVKRANLETIQIGRYKCVTKDSFYRWYENQSHYILKTDAQTQGRSE